MSKIFLHVAIEKTHDQVLATNDAIHIKYLISFKVCFCCPEKDGFQRTMVNVLLCSNISDIHEYHSETRKMDTEFGIRNSDFEIR